MPKFDLTLRLFETFPTGLVSTPSNTHAQKKADQNTAVDKKRRTTHRAHETMLPYENFR